MTSSFPEQQYKPQALSGGFNPIEQVDLAPAIAAEQERQMAPERARLQQLAANDKARIQNARSSGDDLTALGQFSETLAEALVERQKKENEKSMARGVMLRYTEGTDPEEAAAFDEAEGLLKQTKVAADADAADAEAAGASVFTGEKIRKLSGWEKYGYNKANLQIASQGFPVFIAQNADQISVTIDGVPITLNSAKTQEEASAVLSKMVQMYIDDYKDMNPTMLDKYLFKGIRSAMNSQLTLFAQRRGAEIKKERLAERKNDLLLDLRTDPAGQVASEFILNHPSGPSAGRLELKKFLDDGLRNGSINADQAEDIITDGILFNGDSKPSSLIAKFPGVFDGIPQLIEDARADQRARNDRAAQLRQKEFVDSLIPEALESDEAKADKIRQFRQRFPGTPLPTRLANLFTADDGRIEQQTEYLQSIAEANGGQIPPQYTIGVDPSVLESFKDQIDAGVTVESSLKQFKEPRKQFLTGLQNEHQLLDQGQNFNNAEAATVGYNMGKKFDELFAYYSQTFTPEEAFAKTREELTKLTEKEYETFTKIKAPDKIAQDNRRLANQAITKNPNIIKGSIIPGVQDTDLKQAYEYLTTTGTGVAMPYIFKDIAEKYPQFSSVEIAGMQLEAAGFKGYKIPKIETDISNSGNQPLQRLLRYKNTPSRTFRASIEDPELVNVLDVIASKESYSYGGYDAYNLGGSNNGYTAHGPGNSAEDGRFGKPASQLTVGEIMKLHSRGELHAVGRYQFIGPTFKEVVQGLRLPRDTVFNAQVQDVMALYRLRWRLNLQNSTTGLINEWRGLKYLKPAQLQQLLQDAQDVYDPYNSPELLLKGLNGN